MGMFDYYRPSEELHCPECGEELEIWQSKDGECLLLIWQQGEQYPIDQHADEDCKMSKDDFKKCTLPSEFDIYSFDCEKHKRIYAKCKVLNGVWVSTELST